MTMFGTTRFWLTNLPDGAIYNRDPLCAMFIGNFQGTYKHSSTAESLKMIKQKPDESIWDYVKHFCNARNSIPNMQDFKIINAFCDRVSDIKTTEEIAMKKPKSVDDLLAVADVCIEALESNKGPSKKMQ
jgi:hypothetical protein